MIRCEYGGHLKSHLKQHDQTALSSKEPPEKVYITHPNHPLQGQQFKAIKFRKFKKVTELVLLLPDNSRLSVPINWTDYVSDAELPSDSSNSTQLLCMEGLYKISLLIERWQCERNDSKSSKK